MRIETLLRQNALRRPDAPALICEREMLSWAALDRAASCLANALRDRGHGEQERVAIVLPNCHTIPITYFGAWKINLVTVAVNPRMTAPEIERIIAHSGARSVIASVPAAVEAAARCPDVRTVVGVDGVAGAELQLETIVEHGDPTDPPAAGAGTDLRSLRYTSGTTGAPKGCMATHEQQLASVSNFLAQVAVPRDRPTYLSVPMTLGVGAFYLTATAYLGAPLLVRQRFDPEGFAADVADHGVAHAFLVPTMMLDLQRRLGEEPAMALEGLDLLGYGGAQISWSLVEDLHRRLGCELYQGLGATEAGGFATLLTPEDHRELIARPADSALASVGRAAAYADVAIVDADGAEVPAGELGELRIRSASNFSGYWGQPELTRQTLVDGWLALGDVAFRDERGFIFLVDRKGGIIRSGSQNVFPTEVEAVLNSHPAVVRSAALGVPDERFGERVVAVVVLADGPASVGVDEAALVAYCAERLAPHKRPRQIAVADDLPFDEGGKLRRQHLPELFATHATACPPAPARS